MKKKERPDVSEMLSTKLRLLVVAREEKNLKGNLGKILRHIMPCLSFPLSSLSSFIAKDYCCALFQRFLLFEVDSLFLLIHFQTSWWEKEKRRVFSLSVFLSFSSFLFFLLHCRSEVKCKWEKKGTAAPPPCSSGVLLLSLFSLFFCLRSAFIQAFPYFFPTLPSVPEGKKERETFFLLLSLSL